MSGPGQQKGVLTLEETVDPDTAGGAALDWILLESRNLRSARCRARQGAGGSGNSDHDGGGVVGTHGTEVDHVVAGGQFDACHTSGRAALWADIGGAEPQQLRL